MNSLARRTVLGFVQLVIAMGVALFAPAWTLDFVQGWIYLVEFVASAALITVYLWRRDPKLLERRLNAGPAAETELPQKLIQAFAAIAFIGLLVVPSLDHRLGWSRVPLAIVVLGDVLVLLGFVIVFRVFKENTFTAATIEVEANQRVVSTGPYAIVRHPMYAGAMVMLIGTPLALGSWWGPLMSAALGLVIVARLLDEERYLTLHLDGYAEYLQRVRYRLVPFVW